MPELAEMCEVCGNHAVHAQRVQEAIVSECEFCGNLQGPADLIELLELQREAEEMGCSVFSFPLAQFIDKLPGVKLLGDSGGDRHKGSMPFVAFELADHRTVQLENLGQSLRLMRNELSREWLIEFTFDYQLGFELRPRRETTGKATQQEIEVARQDMLLIWRRLQAYRVLGWWKQR